MKITFIGGGNMADALIGGLLRKDFPLQDIRVVEISAEARRKLVDKYGVTSFDKPKDAMRANDVVVFAVKPQHLREAAAKSGIADNANLVISRSEEHTSELQSRLHLVCRLLLEKKKKKKKKILR